MTKTLSKSSYLEGTTIQMDLWGKQFRSLQQQLNSELRSARTPIAHRKLEKLEARRHTLRRRLQEAAHQATGESWEDVRGDLQDAVEDFQGLAVEVHDNVRKA